jgi:hypothetical protein
MRAADQLTVEEMVRVGQISSLIAYSLPCGRRSGDGSLRFSVSRVTMQPFGSRCR